MGRALERRGGQMGRSGQHQRQKALHVAGSAPIEPLAPAHHNEGIGGPGLAVHRHHVGVARQDHAAGDGRTDRGVKVGLGPVDIGYPARRHAQGAKLALEIFDEGQIGEARGGVEADQALQNFKAAAREGFGVDHGRTLEHAVIGPKALAT